MKTFGLWTVALLILPNAECVRVSAEMGLKAQLLSGLGEFFPGASSGRQMGLQLLFVLKWDTEVKNIFIVLIANT